MFLGFRAQVWGLFVVFCFCLKAWDLGLDAQPVYSHIRYFSHGLNVGIPTATLRIAVGTLKLTQAAFKHTSEHPLKP